MRSCVWYVSSSVRPWEKFMIGSMASALKGTGVNVVLCSDGGTSGLDAAGEVISWSSLTLLERTGRIVMPHAGKLWHLWGDPPAWWGIVRSHSRTVHTSFADRPRWRGHPSRIFRAQAVNGETLISPTFSAAVSGAHITSDAHRKTVYTGMSGGIEEIKEAADEAGLPTADIGTLMPDRADTLSGVLVERDDSPLAAIRAAALTMRGLAVVSVSSPYMDELLGRDGYFRADDGWGAAVRNALDGGAAAAAARHFINVRMSADLCADSLRAMYSRAGRSEQ